MEIPPLHVADEWSPLQAAVVYPRAGAMLQCRRGYIQLSLAELLKAEGVELLSPTANPNEERQPLYARDPLFVVDNQAFIAKIGMPRRRHEDERMSALLASQSLPFTRTHAHGGDVLLLPEKRMILGIHAWKEDPSESTYCEEPHETDRPVIAQMNAVRATVHTVCHHDVHADCAIAPLPDGSFLWHRHRLGFAATQDLENAYGRSAFTDIPKHHHRPILNLFWVNPELVLAPESDVCHLLKDRRFQVWSIFGDHLMQGSVRCCVAPLRRGEAPANRCQDHG